MTKRPHRLIILKDRRGEFRWRLEARNGACILSSSEGYKQYRGCFRNLRLVLSPYRLPIPPVWPRGTANINGTWRPNPQLVTPWIFRYVATTKGGASTAGTCIEVKW